MNKTITSQEAILLASKELIVTFGLQELNIRDVAKKCGVSVGSIYNHFPTKSDLIIASITSVWNEIIEAFTTLERPKDFLHGIELLFHCILDGSQKYPGFFSSHSMSIVATDKNKGRQCMENYFSHIKKRLTTLLNADTKVKKDAFTDVFTKEDFIDFVLNNFLALLIKKQKTCDFLLQIITRVIY